MRPPICAICEKDFRDTPGQGGMVSFKLSESDRENNRQFEKRGFVGHPAGQEWFCATHYPVAQTYRHLTYAEAMPLIRQRTRSWFHSFLHRFF
ncbi:MAG: hypothetical protein AAF587_30155 [Bacteroidota bacterium]